MQGCCLRCKYCQNPDTWDPHASTAREYSAEAIMQIVNRSVPYFGASGGVTFSGGEPLLQAEFVKEVFTQCRRSNIHTALDTSLYVSPETVLDIIPLTSLFLADIKHMDDERSLSLTGRSNRNNLDNLKLI
ncbi:MAG TPA: radical SAM protein, partial [Candidatus Wallbacteria bacterium]|nr:radical SAM protein [Candidatus Wallbacteria bacterium]